MSGVREMPTANLVVLVQKLAKDVSYVKPGFRAKILEEAARRLNEYRQRERQEQRT